MARWGRCDYEQLILLQRRLARFSSVDAQRFCEDCAKELAARLIKYAIKATPVGVYSGERYTCKAGITHKGTRKPGKVGGTLRRGWTARTEEEAQSGGKLQSPTAYARTLPVIRSGGLYTIVVTNPVSYASYVEYGHRTVGHKGWVVGHFMLTRAELTLRGKAEKIVEKRLIRQLQGVLNGGG